MANRSTNPAKWENQWFRKLSPKAKVTLWFLLDHVDNAGFLSWDDERCAFYTGLSIQEVDQAIMELTEEDGEGRRRVVFHQREIWLPDYVPSQIFTRKLNGNVGSHKNIIRLEEEHYAAVWWSCPHYVRPVVENREQTNLSIQDIRTRVIDWTSVRDECLGKMPYNLRTGALGEALGEWWDHCLRIGKPIQVHSWRVFCMEVVKHPPETVIAAIYYAIGQNLMTVNFRKQGQILSEDRAATRAHHMPSDRIPEPTGWQDRWRVRHPDSSLPLSWASIPRPVQRALAGLAS